MPLVRASKARFCALGMVSAGLLFMLSKSLTTGRKPFCKHDFRLNLLTIFFYGALRAVCDQGG
jgi:hypothetical protein